MLWEEGVTTVHDLVALWRMAVMHLWFPICQATVSHRRLFYGWKIFLDLDMSRSRSPERGWCWQGRWTEFSTKVPGTQIMQHLLCVDFDFRVQVIRVQLLSAVYWWLYIDDITRTAFLPAVSRLFKILLFCRPKQILQIRIRQKRTQPNAVRVKQALYCMPVYPHVSESMPSLCVWQRCCHTDT